MRSWEKCRFNVCTKDEEEFDNDAHTKHARVIKDKIENKKCAQVLLIGKTVDIAKTVDTTSYAQKQNVLVLSTIVANVSNQLTSTNETSLSILSA